MDGAAAAYTDVFTAVLKSESAAPGAGQRTNARSEYKQFR